MKERNAEENMMIYVDYVIVKSDHIVRTQKEGKVDKKRMPCKVVKRCAHKVKHV